MEADSIPLRCVLLTTFSNQKLIVYISIILLLIILSALFAAFETSFSFLKRTRVESKADEGDKKSIRILKALNKSDKIIVSILIFINIFHIICTTLATILFMDLLGESGAVVSTVVMTLLVFTFSETLPKNIASYNPDKIFYKYFDIFMGLTYLIYPIVFIFSLPYKIINKFIDKEDDSYSEQELSTIVDSIEEEGVIESEESALIQSAMEFDDTSINKIFTPISKVYSINLNTPKNKLIDILCSSPYKRIPVYKDKKENIIGFINTRLALKELFNKDIKIEKLIRSIPSILSTTKLDDVFDKLVDNKTHIATVLNKNNQIIGIVTLNDCLNELTKDYLKEAGDENE